MRIHWEFANGNVRIVRDPACRTVLSLDGPRPHPVCGKPATERRSYWPHWSLMWCPDCASYWESVL